MKSIQTTEFDRMARSRYTELNKMLEERRSQLQAEVQEKMRDVRAEGLHGKMTEVFDAVESSEADIQEDIELALIQMKSETLTKVNDALVRLELGNYGYCFECGEEIAEKRLRALPFAVRCKDCRQPGSGRAASAPWRTGAVLHRSSSTCKVLRRPIPGLRRMAEPLSSPPPASHPFTRETRSP
jgi:DnaK suppressor protein